MNNFILPEVAFNDPRSGFVNKVCKLIYDKVNGDLDKAVKELMRSGLYYDFHEHVRNIYELQATHIPMFEYLQLMTHSRHNWSYTQQEYVEAIESAQEACRLYYSSL